MNGLSKFNQDQRDFVLRCLREGVPVSQVVLDVIEIYDVFCPEDVEVRDALYQRIAKIKARMPEAEQATEAVADTAEDEPSPVYLSASWRVAYFRELLRSVSDVPTKIRLLREIRTEVEIIDADAAQEKKALEAKERLEPEKSAARDLDFRKYEDAVIKEWIHDGSVLPIKDYVVVEDEESLGISRASPVINDRIYTKSLFQRKCDGVIVGGDGEPLRSGDKSHDAWLAEQENYDYDPGSDGSTHLNSRCENRLIPRV